MSIEIGTKLNNNHSVLGAKIRLKRIYFFIWRMILLIFMLFIVVALYMGVNEIKMQSVQLPQSYFAKSFHSVKESVENFRFPIFRILGFNSDFDTIYLNVKQKHMKKLDALSEHDKNTSKLDHKRKDTWVPGTLKVNNEEFPIKLRMKGDRDVHWKNSERRSFKIKAKGGKTILGMKKFSIQHPIMRNYIHEWLFHKILKKEGVIGLRYKFATLFVNGENRGVYVVEEGFGKRLIENNNRREGPILHLEEDTYSGGDIWKNSLFEVYEKKKWLKRSPVMVAKAISMLDKFKNGDSLIHETFDVELFAKYFAISDLLEVFHGSLPKSIRFYYNPVTEKLEPIGFDGHYMNKDYPIILSEMGEYKGSAGFDDYKEWYRAIFNRDIAANIEFHKLYLSNLERYSKKSYLDELFLEMDDELEDNLDFIYSGFPVAELSSQHPRTGITPLYSFSLDKIYKRADLIRSKLALIYPLIVNYDQTSEAINVTNRSKLPINILSIKMGGELIDINNFLLLPKLVFNLQEYLDKVDKKTIYKNLLKNNSVIKLNYQVYGTNNVLSQTVNPWNYYKQVKSRPDSNKLSYFRDHNFFLIDENNKTIQIKPGNWELSKTVVLPKYYKLFGGANTIIDMTNYSRIVSSGGVEIDAENSTNPFKFISSDGTGKGLVVIKSKGKSILKNVRFSNLMVDDKDIWALTSPVLFYESDIFMENVHLSNFRSEDMINIVRSNFMIKNCSFVDTTSDALDSDFSKGEVIGSLFNRIGNDAIDVSGSIINVTDININNVGDKAISVGEASNMIGDKVSIDRASIGIAVKDSSKLDLYNSNIDHTDIGISVFQKKPEYGPGKALIWRTIISSSEQEYLLENGSELIIDGQKVFENSTSVKNKLYQ